MRSRSRRSGPRASGGARLITSIIGLRALDERGSIGGVTGADGVLRAPRLRGRLEAADRLDLIRVMPAEARVERAAELRRGDRRRRRHRPLLRLARGAARRSGARPRARRSRRPGRRGSPPGCWRRSASSTFGEPELLKLTLAAAELYPDFVAELEAASGIATGYRARRRPPRRARPRRGGGAAPRARAAALARPRRRVAAAAPLPRAGARPHPVLQRRRPRRRRRPRSIPGRSTAALLAALEPRRGGAADRDRGGRRRCSTASGSPACAPTAGEELRADDGRARRRRLVGRRPSGCPSPPGRRCARSRARSSSCASRDGAPPCQRIVASERVYLVPRPDGRLIVGATVEEQGFDTAVTAGGVHELLREAYRLLPEVAEMELVEARAGPAPRHAGQPAAGRPRRASRACSGRPATTATGSCWRR